MTRPDRAFGRPPIIAADPREQTWGGERLRAAAGRLPPSAAAGLVVLSAGFLGLLLGAVGVAGGRAGPWLVVGLPALAVLVAVALRAPTVAVALVPLSIAAGDRSVAGGLLPLVQATALLAAGVVVLNRLNAGRGPLPVPPAAWWGLGLLAHMLLSTSRAPELGVAFRRDASVRLRWGP